MQGKFILIPVLSLALIGCDQHEAVDKNSSRTVVDNGDRVGSETDKMLLRPLRNAVNGIAIIPDGNTVKIEVREGNIVLTGVVPSQDAKILLEQTVKSINGVKSIDNQVQIKE